MYIKSGGIRRTLREVTKGHGATCGSGFLDSKMRDYMTRKFAHIGPINDSAMEHIMETFINIIKVKYIPYLCIYIYCFVARIRWY